MKKFLLPLLLTVLLTGIAERVSSQSSSPVVTLFAEDFENPTVLMVPNTPPNASPWAVSTRFGSTGNNCDSSFATGLTRTYLESPVIDISGYVSVNISFDHICYVETLDDARLEVSFNGGATWIRTGPSTYKGSSFLKTDSSFSKFSRPVDWHVAFSDSLWVPPSTTPWVTENFDISSYLVSPNIQSSDSIKFRFSLYDDIVSVRGRVGKHTWYLDNIKLTAAPCELIPPTISLDPPFRYIDVYEDVVYFTGPYDFSAQFRDASTIDSAFLEVIFKPQNGGAWRYDTIDFNVVQGSNYFAEIPAQVIGDTVCYRLIAVDASTCHNKTLLPTKGYYCFLVRDNLPPGCQTKPLFNFPYVQTFNSADFQIGQNIALAEDWVNNTGDFHDWWVARDSTPTAGTGPRADMPGGGKYLYVEATGHQGQTAILLSPCIDLYQIPNASVKFYLNMHGVGGDVLHVDIYDPTINSYQPDVILPISGGKGPNWFDVEFNLYPYRNTISQLRFRGKSNPNSDISDISLDSFKIVYSPLRDLRLEQINISPYNPEGDQDSIDISIRNLGVIKATQADVFFQLYDDTLAPIGGIITSQWTGDLDANEFDYYKLATPYTVPQGDYFVRAWIKMTGDERAANDSSIYQSSFGLPYRPIAYSDNFEGDSLWLATPRKVASVNNWQFGYPAGPTTKGAYSDSVCWDINLLGGYNGNGQLISLYTPFFDFSNKDSMLMYFYNNRQMNLNEDGVFIEYSRDKGRTWDSLPGQHDPKRKFWYNSNVSGTNLGGTPVFSGNSKQFFGSYNGWVETEVLLPSILNNTKYVLFRFNFYAAQDETGGDGMSIDNFRIVKPVGKDAEAVRILKPVTSCEVGDTLRSIRAKIKNVGYNQMSDVLIETRVTQLNGDNITPVQLRQDVISTGNFIQPRDSYIFNTNDYFDFSNEGDYLIEIITKLANDPIAVNDTMRQTIEHVEGCDVKLQFKTASLIADSSRWRFEATKTNGRKYIYIQNYSTLFEDSIQGAKVCLPTESKVTFKLGDYGDPGFTDSSISSFSIFGYDTTYINDKPGGPNAVDGKFDWICPPQLSATPLRIIVDKNAVVFPISKVYQFETVIQNNGLDSIRQLGVKLMIDQTVEADTTLTFDPGDGYPTGLRYTRTRKIDFGYKKLLPGDHEIRVITYLPNGTADLQMEDDTIIYPYSIIDTVYKNISINQYCTDFESTLRPTWLSLNPYTYSPFNSFEKGTPDTTKAKLTAAHSGTTAWVTRLDSNYNNYDSASLYSPFLHFQKDSCYEFNFYHQYAFDDIFHDGAQVQYSENAGVSWRTIDNRGQSFSLNWYNTPHVVAIPSNDQNPGWTGESVGYVQSGNTIGFREDTYGIIRWRFESDGSKTDAGWIIDDFCIQRSDQVNCIVVGLDETDFDANKLQLGQNIPNPASNSTAIPYYLPHSGNVQLVVINMLGQPIYQEEGIKSAGDHISQIDLSSVADGIYFYWIIFDNQKATNKMVISK